jgi:Antitoxin Xre/MbcA/ParS C-terminal toxin-binding domain
MSGVRWYGGEVKPLVERSEETGWLVVKALGEDEEGIPLHLTAALLHEAEYLLRRAFLRRDGTRDTDGALAFLTEHNGALRGKPLELLRRDSAGAEEVLAYLARAAANGVRVEPVAEELRF